MPFAVVSNVVVLPQFFVAPFLFLQGVAVLIQNPRAPLNRWFFAFEGAVTIWIIFMGIAHFLTDPFFILTSIKISMLAVLFIPVATYAFSVYYTRENNQKPVILIGLAAGLLIALFFPTNIIIGGFSQYPWGNYPDLKFSGIAFLLMFAVFIPLFLRNFYRSYRSSPPTEKTWRRAALVSGGLAFFGVLDFLPAFGIWWPSLPPVGYIFVGIFATLMSYFILRFRLANIRIIIGRSLIYLMLSVLIVFIYTSFFLVLTPRRTLSELLYQSAFFGLVAFTFSFLLQLSKKLIDQIFFKDRINIEKHIAKFLAQIHSLRSLDNLLSSYFSFISAKLRLNSPTLFLYYPNERRWRLANERYNSYDMQIAIDFSLDEQSEKYLLQNPFLIRLQETLGYAPPAPLTPLISNLRKLGNYQLVSPLLLRQGTIGGLLLFGEKISGDEYKTDEIQTLNYLVAPFSIAWENALAYYNLEQASKLKTGFISIASHQLRTPVTDLKWALVTLKDEVAKKLNSEQKKLLATSLKSADNLITLISHLLTIVKIEEEESPPSLIPLDINRILQEVKQRFSPDIAKKKIDFSLSLPRFPALVVGNKDYLEKILATLLENALKYTKDGGKILITAKVSDNNLLLTLTDSGIGIPRGQQHRVFDKFFRASNAISLYPNGTGLGLYYVKMLVERQRGFIWFNSQENKGTTFFVSLPLADLKEK